MLIDENFDNRVNQSSDEFANIDNNYSLEVEDQVEVDNPGSDNVDKYGGVTSKKELDLLIHRGDLSSKWCKKVKLLTSGVAGTLAVPPNPRSLSEALEGPDDDKWKAVTYMELSQFF